MALVRSPLAYTGSPPNPQYATVVNSTVRAATTAEANTGTKNDVYISPKTMQAAASVDFASPPVLGFGSTTPRPVHATTLGIGGLTTIADAQNIAVGTTTGTEIGTSASQKLGFFGATPVVQPVTTTDIKTALVNLGLLASGTSPLNLGSGALGSGTFTIADASNIVIGSTTGTKIGTATTQKIGFYNAAPVVQQTQGAIINNVTSGGSTGTIADITDITTYSNAGAGAAIRNDIYQLALGLQGCIAALRTYGLLG